MKHQTANPQRSTRPAPSGRDKSALWIAAGLAMAPTVALGLARFAYALLLPGMQDELGWSYTDAGAMNTANALGYLIGALLTPLAATRFGTKRAFMASLLITAVTLLASGLTGAFVPLLGLRLIAGVTGAVAFVIGASLTVFAVPRDKPGWMPLAMGIYMGGGGLGILVSAMVVPPLLALAGWRGGWIVLGLASFAAAAIALPALRRLQVPAPQPSGKDKKPRSLAFLVPALASYGFFGAGYIAYMTFIVAYLRSRGFGTFEVSAFWACLGAASLLAPFIWSLIITRLKAGWGIASVLGVVTLGALLPVVIDGGIAAFMSALLFGSSFLAVATAITSFAGKIVEPHALTSVMAALTVAFGLGQCIGPLLSGVIADGPHGVQMGLLLSAGILLIGAIIAVFQREPAVTIS